MHKSATDRFFKKVCHFDSVFKWCWWITFRDFNQLKLKGNPGHFGKHVDGTAGLGEQVQVELHNVRVWRLQMLRFPPGSLCVVSPHLLHLLSSLWTELRLLVARFTDWCGETSSSKQVVLVEQSDQFIICWECVSDLWWHKFCFMFFVSSQWLAKFPQCNFRDC